MEEKYDKLGQLPTIVSALEEHPNFIQFTEDELRVFSKYCSEKKIRKDEILFNEGDAAESMFIVKKGTIKVLKMGYLGEIVIVQINPGEFVGEMAVIDGSPRSATVKAVVDSELLELASEKFNLLKKENPQIAMKIMDLLLRILSIRLRTTTLKMLKK
ncbi:MAG: cyclic nucleotide-binding domain-containing protein [Candidatus Firestonebacteria bacterium]